MQIPLLTPSKGLGGLVLEFDLNYLRNWKLMNYCMEIY